MWNWNWSEPNEFRPSGRRFYRGLIWVLMRPYSSLLKTRPLSTAQSFKGTVSLNEYIVRIGWNQCAGDSSPWHLELYICSRPTAMMGNVISEKLSEFPLLPVCFILCFNRKVWKNGQTFSLEQKKVSREGLAMISMWIDEISEVSLNHTSWYVYLVQ